MNIVVVGIGGFLGAIARYAVGLWMPASNGFPFGTLAVNLLGCLFLAWFFNIKTGRLALNPSFKLAIGTGFTGSFTTFSAFSVETIHLLSSDLVMLAIIYVLSSVLGGISLAFLGAKIALMNDRKTEGGNNPS